MQRELFDNDFTDIYLNEGPAGQPVFCFRTGMTVYEETFDKGRLVSAGWNNSGTPLNVLEGMPVRLDHDAFTAPWVFELEADGECLAYDWDYAGFTKYGEAGAGGAKLLHGVVTLKNRLKPLTVEVHTVLSGSAVFTRYLSLKNEGGAVLRISRLSPMSGALEIFYDWTRFVGGEADKEKLYSLGYMENSRACAEGMFRWHDLLSGDVCVTGRYKSDRHRYPMFMLRNRPLGHLWFAQLAWSGGFDFRISLDADVQPNGIGDRDDRARALLGFSMALDAPAPLLALRPGETFVTPEVYIGRVQGDLDDAVNMMHRHTRRAVFTYEEPAGNIASVGAGVGPERAMTQEAVFHTVDTAAAVGAESCIIDAGWYCPAGEEGSQWWRKVGAWNADPDKYGADFAAIRARCREKGLKFGLWMECERMGKDTPVAKAHPDWYQVRRLQGQETTVIDMANPEAAAWVYAEVCRVIETYGVELFRLDYNVDHRTSDCVIETDGVRESSYLRYYRALYDMFAALRRRYPTVIFENCAGGGGRCDLGMVKHFTHTWVSDYQIPPRSFAVTNGMTMVLPPERVDRLVSGMNGHLRASLDFTVRSALFGKPTTNTYNPLGSEMNPRELAFVRRSFALYKAFIRPYMTDGRVFHHTPELYEIEPKGRGILERASNDGTRGVIGIFNLANVSPADAFVTVYPRGLDAGRTYEVTLDNSGAVFTAEGFRLAGDGVRVRLPVSLTSELILYRATEENR